MILEDKGWELIAIILCNIIHNGIDVFNGLRIIFSFFLD
jgi:hypothetical protein